jgi:GntR family transcriptional regulator
VVFPIELQRQFEEAVAAGEYAAGQAVTPSEVAARFGALPQEAIRVLAVAYRKGLVDRAAGGAGGARVVLGLPQTTMDSVFTHTAKAGLTPTSLVRDVEMEAAAGRVAERLRVADGSPVYRYVRTRYVDGRPLANQINYMPAEVCPGLEHDDVSRCSFQKLLEGKYHAVLMTMDERYELAPATDEDCQILELTGSGATVLVIDRVALSATRWPLVWANIRIRPDRYSYVAALWPEAAHLLPTPPA